MLITLELPDDIQTLPTEQQREKIIRALQFVQRTKLETSSSVDKLSKWAKIVQRVENDTTHLAGYSKQLKKDMKEFRDNFLFKHDR